MDGLACVAQLRQAWHAAAGVSMCNLLPSLKACPPPSLSRTPCSAAGLAKEVAWDAVGARCLIEVVVTGAPSMEEAGAVALAVAGCPHVCAAVQAGAPNWRVIADAARWAGRVVGCGSSKVV